MCFASTKPSISSSAAKADPLTVAPPEETASVTTGADADKAKKAKRKAALGAKQLTIPTNDSVGASGARSGINA